MAVRRIWLCGKPNNEWHQDFFSVSGDVQRPGNYEVPLGTPFRQAP